LTPALIDLGVSSLRFFPFCEVVPCASAIFRFLPITFLVFFSAP
jgi:hypothetical protein